MGTMTESSKVCSADSTGRIPELKEWVYDIVGESGGVQADRYTETTKRIGEYAGKTYGPEMQVLVLLGKESVPEEPSYPSGEKASEQEKAVWSKKFDHYLKEEALYH